jgi:hypothetical protein
MIPRPRWLVRCGVAVAVVLVFALAAREFPVLVVLVTLVGGLAGLAYLSTCHRGMPALPAEEERGKRERFLREVPPSQGGVDGSI